MHAELTAALAGQHRRDLMARAAPRPAPAPGLPRRPRARRGLLPRYRLTWTGITLATQDSAAAADGSRSRSWIIVISATRSP